jgi:hypothetical protein
MADGDHNRTNAGKNYENDQLDPKFDRELDAALAKYAAVEPRPGLEDRVLANLRAEEARVPERAWWRWSAVGVAAAIVIAVLAFRSGEPSHPVVMKHPPTVAPAMQRPGARVGMAVAKNSHPPARPPANRIPHWAGEPPVSAGPKLDQFPSPQPLSTQELALTRYVSQFPEEATLIARAQYEYETEIQQKMKDAIPEIKISDSDQQER